MVLFPVCVCVCSQLCPTLSTLAVARQAPLSMEFSRQDYWNGLPFPPLGDLPDPGVEPTSLLSPVLAGRIFFFFFYYCATWDAPSNLFPLMLSVKSVCQFR